MASTLRVRPSPLSLASGTRSQESGSPPVRRAAASVSVPTPVAGDNYRPLDTADVHRDLLDVAGVQAAEAGWGLRGVTL